MRNLAFFLGAFFLVCAFGLLTACTLPNRLPEPYEKRTAQADIFDSDWDRQKRVNADWWNCTRYHRADEC